MASGSLAFFGTSRSSLGANWSCLSANWSFLSATVDPVLHQIRQFRTDAAAAERHFAAASVVGGGGNLEPELAVDRATRLDVDLSNAVGVVGSDIDERRISRVRGRAQAEAAGAAVAAGATFALNDFAVDVGPCCRWHAAANGGVDATGRRAATVGGAHVAVITAERGTCFAGTQRAGVVAGAGVAIAATGRIIYFFTTSGLVATVGSAHVAVVAVNGSSGARAAGAGVQCGAGTVIVASRGGVGVGAALDLVARIGGARIGVVASERCPADTGLILTLVAAGAGVVVVTA